MTLLFFLEAVIGGDESTPLDLKTVILIPHLE